MKLKNKKPIPFAILFFSAIAVLGFFSQLITLLSYLKQTDIALLSGLLLGSSLALFVYTTMTLCYAPIHKPIARPDIHHHHRPESTASANAQNQRLSHHTKMQLVKAANTTIARHCDNRKLRKKSTFLYK